MGINNTLTCDYSDEKTRLHQRSIVSRCVVCLGEEMHHKGFFILVVMLLNAMTVVSQECA